MPAFDNCPGGQEEMNQHCPGGSGSGHRSPQSPEDDAGVENGSHFLSWQEEGAAAVAGGAPDGWLW